MKNDNIKKTFKNINFDGLYYKYVSVQSKKINTLALYQIFQKELGIPKHKRVSYGFIAREYVDHKKLFLFKIKYGL